MKKFEYNNTVEQQADVICYAFSPDLLEASEKDLKNFLTILSKYFPKTDNGDGGFKPMNENQSLLNTFNNAYKNVSALIESKKEKKRHWRLFWVSLLTLIVLIATLANTICLQSRVNSKPQEETLNKKMNSDRINSSLSLNSNRDGK